jgi:outer membrane protein TolC
MTTETRRTEKKGKKFSFPLLSVLRVSAVISSLSVGAWAQAPNQAVPGSPERTYTLDDSLRLVRNDPRLQSAEQDVIIADSRVTEAELAFLPEVGVQASATKYSSLYPFALSGDSGNILLFPQGQLNNQPENLYSSRAYFNLPLYEGQRSLNTLKLTQAAAQQAKTNRDSVKMDLVLQVKEAFFRLLLAQEKAKAADEYSRAVDALAAESDLGPWDAVEAQSALAGARARASETQHELESSRLTYLKALNLELDTPFRVIGDLKTAPASVDVERAVITAMDQRPELQSQTYKAQMDAIGVNLALSRRYPSVFVAGDYELTAQEFPLNKNNWDVSVGVKLPFTYDFWSQITQKRAEQRQGQLTRAELQDRVRLEVRQAAESLRYWQEELPRREAQWTHVEALFRAATGKAGGVLSKIRAREGLSELRLSYLTAVTEHLLARARLERAVGREDIAP